MPSETEKILAEAGYDKAKETGKSEEVHTDKPKTRTPQFKKLEKQLQEMYGGLVLIAQTTGNTVTAQIISNNTETLAASWIDLAEQNPAVKRVIEKMVTGGAWGGVLVAHGSVLLPILAHHGVLPEPAQSYFRDINTALYGARYGETPTTPNGSADGPWKPASVGNGK